LTTLENLSPHHDKYFQQLLDTPIHPCVCCHQLWFKKQTRKILKSTIQKYSLHDPPQEKNPLLCKIYYSFFNKNKTPKLLVPTNIRLNNDIDFVKKLYELEEWLVSLCLAFAQIWQLQGYGQYNIKGSIINVPSNINSTQSILPHLPHDEATIVLSLKKWMEYKSPYLTGNVHPNLIMLALHELLNTPLYENSK
jgi:hypothetical protein